MWARDGGYDRNSFERSKRARQLPAAGIIRAVKAARSISTLRSAAIQMRKTKQHETKRNELKSFLIGPVEFDL